MGAEGERVDELAAALAEARAAWPDVALDELAFAAELRRRTADTELGALHVADLYLAAGCAAGNAAALAHLERTCMPAVRATLARLRYTPAQIDDALQAMREDLLVSAPGKAPGIAQFAGRGPLRGWLRVVAGHVAGRLHKRKANEGSPLEHAGELVDIARDPEVALLHRTYGAAVADATREALAKLPVRERLLLKQRFRHGLELEQLAVLHRVHASTISRWVARARGLLVQGIRDVVMAKLGLSASEVLSVMRLVESGLEVTLSSVDERAG
jgi:RNA polymerase sigma-70 factor (ECF subfamily)